MKKTIDDLPDTELGKRPKVQEALRELFRDWSTVTVGQIAKFVNTIIDIAVDEAVDRASRKANEP